MSDVQIEQKEKNTIKLTITITVNEAQPYLEEASNRLASGSAIPGFRPGKAPYDIVKSRFGEMKIYEEALETIVRKSYVEAILANNLETVGSPKIDVVKLAPENDIVFTAEVSKMPQTTSIADYEKLEVKANDASVTDNDIELALNDLRRMQTKEVRAENGTEITDKDKIIVSMNMKKDGVPVEGGQSPNHAIYLTEDYYIPGLKEKVVGLKENDNKTFSLKFPKEHVQKILAGNEVEFEITIKEIYHLETPEVNDEFSKTLGMKDLENLKTTISTNIQKEKNQEERFRQEKEMLELIAKNSRFDEIPELLLNEEINKMIHELKQGVEAQGHDFNEYLKNINKTVTQMKVEFSTQAMTRIKVALIMKTIANDKNIKIKEEDIDNEIDNVAKQYDNEEAKKKIFSPEYRDQAEQMMKNRKVIDLLRETMVKSDG